MTRDRSNVVSSFTIIKGALIEETYAAFLAWNPAEPREANLQRLKAENPVGASSANWLRDLSYVFNRRFDIVQRDRPLLDMAKVGMSLESWRPLLLWHITRDEFLLRDFLVNWLYGEFEAGTFRLKTPDLLPYLARIQRRKDIEIGDRWSDKTAERVARGLLKMSVDFGLLKGSIVREFTSYSLPDEAFLYLLHAMADLEPNAGNLIHSDDWKMYLMSSAAVERELLRLHQYGQLHYEAAGTLVRLDLPCDSLEAYTRRLCA